MKRIIYCSLLSAVLLGCATAALASTVDLTFTSVNGANQGGVYLSPYYATIDGRLNVPIFCDDFVHDIFFGESWTANVYTFSDLSQVRFQGETPAQTLQRYSDVAWLLDQLSTHPSDLADINFAIWSVMTPSTELHAGFTLNAFEWLEEAEVKAFRPSNLQGWEILTPVSSGPDSPQEMFTPVPTPEPASLALFGSGLLAVATLVRKRMQ